MIKKLFLYKLAYFDTSVAIILFDLCFLLMCNHSQMYVCICYIVKISNEFRSEMILKKYLNNGFP